MSPTLGFGRRLPSHLTSLSSPCHLRGCLDLSGSVGILNDFFVAAKFVGKTCLEDLYLCPLSFWQDFPKIYICRFQGNFASKKKLLNVETLRRKHPPPFMPSALINVPSKKNPWKIHGKSPAKLQQTKAPAHPPSQPQLFQPPPIPIP